MKIQLYTKYGRILYLYCICVLYIQVLVYIVLYVNFYTNTDTYNIV